MEIRILVEDLSVSNLEGDYPFFEVTRTPTSEEVAALLERYQLHEREADEPILLGIVYSRSQAILLAQEEAVRLRQQNFRNFSTICFRNESHRY